MKLKPMKRPAKAGLFNFYQEKSDSSGFFGVHALHKAGFFPRRGLLVDNSLLGCLIQCFARFAYSGFGCGRIASGDFFRRLFHNSSHFRLGVSISFAPFFVLSKPFFG